jgi:DNA-binding response OmpR family regulator
MALENERVILIIEDEVPLLRSYGELLKSAGYNVLLAENGYKGLEILSSNVGGIDLTLLDLMMPGIDGLDVLRTINKDHSKYGDMPIVILTRMKNETIVKETFDLGVSSYLVKTDTDASGLLKEIDKFLG